MSVETPWRGAGMEWGDPREKPCRPHEWTNLRVGEVPEMVGADTLAVCEHCHVRRCTAENRSGRCLHAIHHPQGTYHRYPDLMSEPVGGKMLVPGKLKPLKKRRPDDPPLQDA